MATGGNTGGELLEDKWKGEDALRCEVDAYAFVQTIWLQVMIMGQVHNSSENRVSWDIDRQTATGLQVVPRGRTGSQCRNFFLDRDEVVPYSAFRNSKRY